MHGCDNKCSKIKSRSDIFAWQSFYFYCFSMELDCQLGENVDFLVNSTQYYLDFLLGLVAPKSILRLFAIVDRVNDQYFISDKCLYEGQ